MRAIGALFWGCIAAHCIAAQPPECAFDAPNPSPPRDLPLCGNGRLDPGEICDDGNQLNFDGCNAFCSAFDAMPAAATLLGGMTPCPGGKKTVVNGGQTQFCSLRAIDTALDGSYVILADKNTLLRYDLYTDSTRNSIRELRASIDRVFSEHVCSVAVLRPDAAILLHDCGAQQLFVAVGGDGAQVQLVADWADYFAPQTTSFKAHYDKERRAAVVAGVKRYPTDAALFAVQHVNVSAFDVNLVATASVALLAEIPRIVYNVWEGGTKRPSMDLSTMEPRAVLHEPCPPTFRALQKCFAFYLEDPTHMDFLRIYLPEEGGLDMEFYSESAASKKTMDNAFGHPLIRRSGSLVYSLRGSCFQIESRVLTDEGKTPPIIPLGNACRPRLGLKCATPFNNPFITDVITTPILLPEGLSVTHTHLELAHIFAATCPAAQNRSGPALYRSVLRSVYADTLPVDFTELTGIMDVVYITPTSVGLISTKRIALYDRTRPGYVRATNLILCPRGSFGEVGGVCAPCQGHTFPPNTRIPVAYQIQCDDSAFETFTVITSKNVTSEDVHRGICVYTAGKNETCAPEVSLASPQPFNMAADALDAEQTLYSSNQALVPCLIAEAERATGRTIARKNTAEYNARVVSQGVHILQAAANPLADQAEYADPADAATARTCRGDLVRGVGGFLRCAVPRASSAGAGRRLLQQQQAPAVSLHEHQGPVYASTSPISWDRRSDEAFRTPSAPRGTADAGDGALPLWAMVLLITAACVLVLAVIAYFVCYRGSVRRALARN